MSQKKDITHSACHSYSFDKDVILYEEEVFSSNLIINLKDCNTIRFVHCSFSNGITFKGGVNKIEFIGCNGAIVNTHINAIFITLEESEISIINSEIGLNPKTVIRRNSLLTYRGKKHDYSSDVIVVDETSELVLKDAKLTVNFLNVEKGGIVTVDESNPKGIKLRNELNVYEASTYGGHIRLKGKEKFILNGHVIDPKKEGVESGLYKNQYMSLALMI